MIASSDFAMFAIDVLVIGGVALALFVAWRYGAFRVPAPVWSASFWVAAALVVTVLLHMADLIGRFGPEGVISEAFRQEWMRQLHLNYGWAFRTLAILLFCGGFLVEIGARRKSARALEVSEARYRSIVEGQSDQIVRWKPDGRITWANDSFCEFVGQNVSDVLGRNLREFSHSSIQEYSFDEVILALSPRASRSINVRETRSVAGPTHWLEWVDTGIFDAKGVLVEVQSVGRDVTDAIQAARALQRSEARFRGFVENTSDWVWEIDAEGRSVYNNGRVQQLLGYSPSQIRGMHWSDLTHPDDYGPAQEMMDRCAADKRGWQRLVCRLRHRDGRYRYLESTADPLLDDKGRIVSWQGIDRDATFETLMAQMSMNFVGCSVEQLGERIELALKEISACYGVERASHWWIDGNFAKRTSEWAVNGTSGPSPAIQMESSTPLIWEELRRGRVVRFDSLSALPPESKDRYFLVGQGVQSFLAIPIVRDERMIAVTAFATLSHERSWSEKSESDLSLLSDKLTAAYLQGELVRDARRRERDQSQSESLARMGSYSHYPTAPGCRFPEEWHLDFSKEQCRLFEIDWDEASYAAFFDRVHEEDREHVARMTEKIMRGASEIEFEFRIVTPGGRVVHLANRTRADHDRDGEIIRIIGANLDITDRVDREADLERALEENRRFRERLEAENVRLREAVRSVEEFEQIVGESDELRATLELVAKAAPRDVPVLITGETGTGKELIAKALHNLSARKEREMVSLNCTALPDSLVESELFGHESGAFTGAVSSRAGRFELASGSTLFLDEIGDLPLELQGKLLRVLEDGSFDRLGSTKTRKADVRVIAATNRDLRQAVARGEFRSDLYYRINTVHIDLPPLRARRGDIPLLAHHFVMKHSARMGSSVKYISAEMLRYLQQQEWQGNVRELEHFIERALISTTGNVLTCQLSANVQLRRDAGELEGRKIVGADLRAVERSHIMRVLDDADWKISGEAGAAARLNLPASTLRSKMKRLGIRRDL